MIESFHTSKDVLPTIYDLCGLKAPNEINGKSLLNPNNAPDYAISEYMGGGCPDMIERPIQFMIRNAHYLVCYNVKMNDPFEEGKLVEVYDLEQDPDELTNISNRPEIMSEIKGLLELLEIRKNEISKSYII